MDGEPSQDPNFLERMTVVARHGLGSATKIQTNGQFLSERNAEAILAVGVSRVTIDFDGASKPIYEQHRVRCDYDRVFDNIKRFAARRRELGAKTVISI